MEESGSLWWRQTTMALHRTRKYLTIYVEHIFGNGKCRLLTRYTITVIWTAIICIQSCTNLSLLYESLSNLLICRNICSALLFKNMTAPFAHRLTVLFSAALFSSLLFSAHAKVLNLQPTPGHLALFNSNITVIKLLNMGLQRPLQIPTGAVRGLTKVLSVSH